jgi:hypothetical protein
MGTKRHLLVDGRGTHLAIVVTGTNRHDVTQTERVLDSIVVTRPKATAEKPQHLCADKAYDSNEARDAMIQRGYIPHVRSRGEVGEVLLTIVPDDSPTAVSQIRTFSPSARFKGSKRLSQHRSAARMLPSFPISPPKRGPPRTRSPFPPHYQAEPGQSPVGQAFP